MDSTNISTMNRIERLVEQLRAAPQNVRFRELAQVCEHYFGKPRQLGTSHQVYKTPWPGDPRVNIQAARGKAKTYQVRQVLRAIARLEVEHHGRK